MLVIVAGGLEQTLQILLVLVTILRGSAEDLGVDEEDAPGIDLEVTAVAPPRDPGAAVVGAPGRDLEAVVGVLGRDLEAVVGVLEKGDIQGDLTGLDLFIGGIAGPDLGLEALKEGGAVLSIDLVRFPEDASLPFIDRNLPCTIRLVL